MAKLGNEAKLILRLFEERVNAQLTTNIRSAESSGDAGKICYANQTRGLEQALAILKSIHLEITED